jgi:hypothetical protein
VTVFVNAQIAATECIQYPKESGFVPADRIWRGTVGVCEHVLSTKDLADHIAGSQPDGYGRETFSLPREQAPAKQGLPRYPKAAYMSEVERWCELPAVAIEFTMRKLRTAG